MGHAIPTRHTIRPNAPSMEGTVAKRHAISVRIMAAVPMTSATGRLATFASTPIWMNTLIQTCAQCRIVQRSGTGNAMQVLKCTTRELAIGMEGTAVRKHAMRDFLTLVAVILPIRMIVKTLNFSFRRQTLHRPLHHTHHHIQPYLQPLRL